MPPVNLDNFTQAATSLGVSNNALRVAGNDVTETSRVRSIFMGRSDNRETMEAFIDAVAEHYGEEAGKVVGAMLAGAMEEGKPLTARMVRQLMAVAENEGNEGAAWRQTVDAEVVILRNIIAPAAEESRQQLLSHLRELARDSIIDRGVSRLQAAVERLNPDEARAIQNILHSVPMREVAAIISQGVEVLTGGTGRTSVNLQDTALEARYNTLLRERQENREIAQTVGSHLEVLERLVTGRLDQTEVALEPHGSSWITSSPEARNLAESLFPNFVGGDGFFNETMPLIAQLEGSGGEYFRGNTPLVRDTRAVTRTTMARENFAGMYRNLCAAAFGGRNDIRPSPLAIARAANILTGQELQECGNEDALNANRLVTLFNSLLDGLHQNSAFRNFYQNEFTPMLEGVRAGLEQARDSMIGGMGQEVRQASPDDHDLRLTNFISGVGFLPLFAPQMVAGESEILPYTPSMQTLIGSVLNAGRRSQETNDQLNRLIPGFTNLTASMNTAASRDARRDSAVERFSTRCSALNRAGNVANVRQLIEELRTSFTILSEDNLSEEDPDNRLDVSGVLREGLSRAIEAGGGASSFGEYMLRTNSPFRDMLFAMNQQPSPAWAGFVRDTLLPMLCELLPDQAASFQALMRLASAVNRFRDGCLALNRAGNVADVRQRIEELRTGFTVLSEDDPDNVSDVSGFLREGLNRAIEAGGGASSFSANMLRPNSPFRDMLFAMNQQSPPVWAGFVRDTLLPMLGELLPDQAASFDPAAVTERNLSLSAQRAILGENVFVARGARLDGMPDINAAMGQAMPRVNQAIHTVAETNLRLRWAGDNRPRTEMPLMQDVSDVNDQRWVLGGQFRVDMVNRQMGLFINGQSFQRNAEEFVAHFPDRRTAAYISNLATQVIHGIYITPLLGTSAGEALLSINGYTQPENEHICVEMLGEGRYRISGFCSRIRSPELPQEASNVERFISEITVEVDMRPDPPVVRSAHWDALALG